MISLTVGGDDPVSMIGSTENGQNGGPILQNKTPNNYRYIPIQYEEKVDESASSKISLIPRAKLANHSQSAAEQQARPISDNFTQPQPNPQPQISPSGGSTAGSTTSNSSTIETESTTGSSSLIAMKGGTGKRAKPILNKKPRSNDGHRRKTRSNAEMDQKQSGGSSNISATGSSSLSAAAAVIPPTLPVSMEDTDLFPRTQFGLNDHAALDLRALMEMQEGLKRIWWSRLVTATRGYVVNAFKDEEQLVFLFDDTFIYIHQCLVEDQGSQALQLLKDIQVVESEGTDALQSLEDGYAVDETANPFYAARTRTAYRHLFGPPGPETYARAFKMGFAFLVFHNIVCRLQERWRETRRKSKGIRFSEDPEWQPDSRVVMFQVIRLVLSYKTCGHLTKSDAQAARTSTGNQNLTGIKEFKGGHRAWIISDYDRHVIAFWRPKGVNVIFGDRYIQCKLEEGFKLCAYCGILESFKEEFTFMQYVPGDNQNRKYFCSSTCQELYG